MKILFALVALVGIALQPLRAEAPPTEVKFFDHVLVAQDFVRGFPMLVNDRYRVQPGRRTGPGQVEVHDRDTDIFYVLEGSAAFVTGGTAVNSQICAPKAPSPHATATQPATCQSSTLPDRSRR